MNFVYRNTYRELGTAGLDWVNDTIKASALSSAYSANENHRYYDELSGVLATVTLANCNIINGAFDSDDPAFTGGTGTAVAIAVWKDTGTASTSPLIVYHDTDGDGAALSQALSNNTWNYVLNNTNSRWFKLGTSTSDTGSDALLAFTSTTVTSATTATINQHVLYNASGGGFTITAPASPSRDDTFGIKNNHDTDATSITVDGNSNNIEDPAGGGATGTSISIGEANCSYVWQYDGADWVVVP